MTNSSSGTPKSTISLGLGVFANFAFCVPCVGAMLYMFCVAGAMVCGFVSHSEAANDPNENPSHAKIGMLASILPILFTFMIIFIYIVVLVITVFVSFIAGAVG